MKIQGFSHCLPPSQRRSPWYMRWLPPRGWCGLPRIPPPRPPSGLPLKTGRRQERALAAGAHQAAQNSTTQSSCTSPTAQLSGPSPHEWIEAAHAAGRRPSHHKDRAIRAHHLPCRCGGGASQTRSSGACHGPPTQPARRLHCLPPMWRLALRQQTISQQGSVCLPSASRHPTPTLTIAGPPPGPNMPPTAWPCPRRPPRRSRCRSYSACIFCSLRAGRSRRLVRKRRELAPPRPQAAEGQAPHRSRH